MVKKKKKEKKNNKIQDKHATYWEYFSLVMFLVFSTLFISMLIIEIFYVFGTKGVWLAVPTTGILWGISYEFARLLFKKK